MPITVALPNATLSGNCLILCLMCDASQSTPPTVTDNLSSGIWGSPAVSSVGGERLDIFVALNCPAGITTLEITYSGTPARNQISVYEFSGIASSSALDGTSSGTTDGGTITTTANGGLIFSYGAQYSGSAVSLWTPGAGFQLLNAQNLNSGTDPSAFSEFMVQSTAGAVTPTIGGSNGSRQQLSIALKSATAGTPRPPGIRVVNVQGYNFYGYTQASGPWSCQFPTRGNLIHMSITWYPNTPTPLSGFYGMSDTAGNTYTTNTGAISSADSSAGYAQAVRASGAGSSNSNNITFNADPLFSQSHDHIEFYDVAGFTAYDTSASATGVQTTDDQMGGQHVLSTVSLIPSQANELIINVCAIDDHDLSGVYDPNNVGYRSDIADAPNFNGAGSGLETDCGFAHLNAPNASQATFIYTVQNENAQGISGVYGWCSVSSAYR